MGIQDRRYNSGGSGGGSGDYGEGGGFRRALRRIFVEGDNFFGWSLPLFTVPRWVPGIRAIQVRIHLLFILFIVGQLIWPVQRSAVGFTFAAFSMLTLWTLVILHEFGHCLACRLVGGEADRVLLWPLGGLAMCRPPHRWKASLITTLGGPGVNFVLIPILGGIMLALGSGWGAIVFNPFDPKHVLLTEAWFQFDTSYWRYFLWSAYFTNLALFLFNMALVMYPMDAGRIVQELLWSRLGYKRSMTIATNLGIFMAFVVGFYGFLAGVPMLVMICLFGGITCYNQRRMLATIEDVPNWAYDTDKGYGGFDSGPGGTSTTGFFPGSAEDKAYKAALKRQHKEQEHQREVDRILEKIRDKGMQSLSGREKATLQDATERGRGKD